MRVIGHYLHHSRREGYEADMARKKAKNEAGDHRDPTSAANPNYQYRQSILEQRMEQRRARAENKERTEG